MAQAKLNSQDKAGSTLKDKETEPDKKKGSSRIPRCLVCLQICVYQAKIPCNHVYCCQCFKGVAIQSERCPMCVQEIPPDFLDRPQLVEVEVAHKELDSSEEKYQWFYEGRNVMAQAKLNSQDKAGSTLKDKETEPDKKKGSLRMPRCLVCLKICVYQAKIPCNHVYCCRCFKGVAIQSERCPMCVQEIPPDFLDRPQLVEVEEAHKELDSSEEEYQWFYEGRNGWWKYDSRTNQDLETMYKLGRTNCEISICDKLYIVDFQKNCQYRKNSQYHKRYIKRDKTDAPCAGVLRID